MDMSKSQIEMLSQSSTDTNINTSEQSNIISEKNLTDDSPRQELMDYEKSVTEKENMLMSSFHKMSLNGNGLNNNLLETNNNLNLLNGQHGKDSQASDLIIGDGNSVATNGHEKSSIENTL